MAEQYDSLGEKAKLVDISLKYTDGDIEKAKEMASGQLDDNIVIKGKFFLIEKGLSGLFLAFFNSDHEFISNVTSAISSNASIFQKVRIFDDWKMLYNNITGFKGGDDIVDSAEFDAFLIDSFVQFDIFPEVKNKNLDVVTNSAKDILRKFFKSPKIQSQIELDFTSSLAMDMAGIVIDMPGAEPADDADKVSPDEGYVEDERIAKIESEAEYIIEGKVIVAPVKGKYINDINPGEKMKVMLTGDDVISEKVLKALNGMDETGAKYPINGRVKAKIPMDKSGFIIYALVAKGVMAKIIEEENIKIQVEKPIEEDQDEANKGDNKAIIIMAVAVGVIILIGLLLLAIL